MKQNPCKLTRFNSFELGGGVKVSKKGQTLKKKIQILHGDYLQLLRLAKRSRCLDKGKGSIKKDLRIN